MECTNGYEFELILASAILAISGVVSLAYSAHAADRTALGDALLDACGGDKVTAALAIDNVRQETALLIDVVRANRAAQYRVIPGKGGKGWAYVIGNSYPVEGFDSAVAADAAARARLGQ